MGNMKYLQTGIFIKKNGKDKKWKLSKNSNEKNSKDKKWTKSGHKFVLKLRIKYKSGKKKEKSRTKIGNYSPEFPTRNAHIIHIDEDNDEALTNHMCRHSVHINTLMY